jgi:transcription-repair coupling factor (superfamily II helicase)
MTFSLKGGIKLLGLLEYFVHNDDLKSITKGIDGGLKEQLVAGLSGSSRQLFIASVYRETRKPILVATHNLFQAQKIYDDLCMILSEREVFLYPVNELIASEIGIASPELKSARIEVLNMMSQNKCCIIVAPIAGLRRLLPTKEDWIKSQLKFQVGDVIDVDVYLNRLVEMGYERTGMVATPGEFSVRGGIIDVYPLTEEFPVRIELFDTEVDSIRTFTIDNQRSQDNRQSEIIIGPAKELIIQKSQLVQGTNLLEIGFAKTLKKVKDDKVKELLVENITPEIEQLKNSRLNEQVFKYLSLFYDHPASLIDYLPENGIVFLDEISRIHEMSDSLDKEEAEWYTGLLADGKIIHDVTLSHKFVTLGQQSSKPFIYLSLFLRHVPHTNPQNIVNMTCKQMQNFHGQMHILKSELERFQKGNYQVVFLGSNEERMKKLESVFEDYDLNVTTVLNN